ncbi:hypothetical protein FGO68_gene12048 [Halteria grandinella]|uniref:Uncharacterized protein n=1 Tax=Halteria grandinella TaxID=5974 RepID=A0A8J8T9P5_HALGN|nr:hypothetical protein FGO68_gene12048 [Halteria grandinella]
MSAAASTQRLAKFSQIFSGGQNKFQIQKSDMLTLLSKSLNNCNVISPVMCTQKCASRKHHYPDSVSPFDRHQDEAGARQMHMTTRSPENHNNSSNNDRYKDISSKRNQRRIVICSPQPKSSYAHGLHNDFSQASNRRLVDLDNSRRHDAVLKTIRKDMPVFRGANCAPLSNTSPAKSIPGASSFHPQILNHRTPQKLVRQTDACGLDDARTSELAAEGRESENFSSIISKLRSVSRSTPGQPSIFE